MSKIHVNRTGVALGQFTQQEVEAGIRSGQFLAGDLGWREGMPQWKKLEQWADFDSLFEVSPPLAAVSSAAELHSGAPPQAGGGLPVADIVRDGPAWEQRESLGFMPALVATVKETLFNPMEMFARMKTAGGLKQPLLYYALTASVGTGVAVLMQALMQLGTLALSGESSAIAVTGGILVGYLVVMPFLLVAVLMIYALLVLASLWVLGVRDMSYEALLRVACYGMGTTALLSVVPFCGGLIGTIWGIVLFIIGLTKVHTITSGKAAAAVLIPFLVFCGLFVTLIVVGISAGLAGL